MTWQEFRDWYDTLNHDDQLKVMRLIMLENFDEELPKEHPSIKTARENVRRKFYEGTK